MDKRGFATDPYRERNTLPKWFDNINSDTDPSPYETAAWTYWHDFSSFSEVPYPGQVDGWVEGFVRVYDSKASDPYNLPEYFFGEPEGLLLGEIRYEIDNIALTITEWSHYNWRNAEPIRHATRVLLNELPDCVQIVQVKDSPHSFWVSEGFISPYKGSEMLVHKNYLDIATAY
jgi:hypothetical protein